MSDNTISLKTISELAQYNFFIPSYQRGYRWTAQQVADLLNDITEFSPKEVIGSDDKTWYCLQPIVVKSRGDKWDVIDGQQRLTTIYLILNYLNQGYSENRRKKLFELQYETRLGSEDYLKNQLGKLEEDNLNIDYHYISKAFQTVSHWFAEKGQSFDINSFESKFNHSTKVIWYEAPTADSIDIFTRINIGKIPLTNAELIKALFLNSSNFKNSDSDKIRLKQLEIASEWDRIEYSLQDDSFWYFLNNNVNPVNTRIEFIFELMIDGIFNSDEYSTFRYFNSKFKTKTEKEISDNWQDVKQHYQSLEEWFTDRELYHKIGFLISTGTEIKYLLPLKKDKSKIEFKQILNDLIKQKVKVQLTDLEYPNSRIRSILLLHNIQTMLNNSNETNLFPFDRYKKEKWDVEHIAAIAEDMPTTDQHQRDWLIEVSGFITDTELKSKTKKYNKDTFEQLYNEILNHFSESKKHEDINDISNLALLDAGTNRSYQNAIFPIKRTTIIEREKSGTFIPVCTKNVFMKFYSSGIPQMTFWGHDDRNNYLSNILTTVKQYLPEQIITRNAQ